MSETLFSHLATRFTSSPENIATEALCYIFERSGVARRAFVRVLRRSGADLAEDHRFSTQHSGLDRSIPDLVGLSPTGDLEIVCEAKFAAGLTDNQPLSYLARLPALSSGVLLFIVPERRIERLWTVLLGRCDQGSVVCTNEELLGESYRCCTIEAHRLAMVSWATLLAALRHEIDVAGELNLRSDIDQLIGLCNKMDSEAFVPLRSEELTGEFGRRIQQLCDITDRITDRLVGMGVASISGLRASASRGWYGRYMKFGHTGGMVQFSSRGWMQWAPTPLWLVLHGNDWKYSEDVRAALASYEAASPPRLFRDERGVYIPIALPTNAELEEVVSVATEQIQGVLDMLGREGLLDRPLSSATNLGSALQADDLQFGTAEPT